MYSAAHAVEVCEVEKSDADICGVTRQEGDMKWRREITYRMKEVIIYRMKE